MAVRILAAWYLVEQDKGFPETNFNSWFPNDPVLGQHINVQTNDTDEITYKVAASSHILLKNTNNALPLKRPNKVVLVGSDAGPPPNGPNGFADRGGVSGTLAMGWGSG